MKHGGYFYIITPNNNISPHYLVVLKIFFTFAKEHLFTIVNLTLYKTIAYLLNLYS